MIGKKVNLRALEPEDIGVLYKWENDPRVWRVSGSLTPFSKYILKLYIEESHKDIYESRQVRFIIVENRTQRAVGAIDLFDFDPHNRRAGVGILIYGKEQQRCGYASEALDILVEYCSKTLSLHQLYCNITAENEASLNLFRSKGFTECGIKRAWTYIDGAWCDEIMLQLILD